MKSESEDEKAVVIFLITSLGECLEMHAGYCVLERMTRDRHAFETILKTSYMGGRI